MMSRAQATTNYGTDGSILSDHLQYKRQRMTASKVTNTIQGLQGFKRKAFSPQEVRLLANTMLQARHRYKRHKHPQQNLEQCRASRNLLPYLINEHTHHIATDSAGALWQTRNSILYPQRM